VAACRVAVAMSSANERTRRSSSSESRPLSGSLPRESHAAPFQRDREALPIAPTPSLQEREATGPKLFSHKRYALDRWGVRDRSAARMVSLVNAIFFELLGLSRVGPDVQRESEHNRQVEPARLARRGI
jgi:hypothetical protein